MTIKSCIEESLVYLRMELPEKDQKSLEQIAEMVSNPGDYPELYVSASARHQLGYLQGLADGLDITVLEMFDEYLV